VTRTSPAARGAEAGGCTVEITIPIPPATLSKNSGHGHWSTYHRAFQEAKDNAYAALCEELGAVQVGAMGPLVMEAIWRYSNASHIPDDDNMVARLAACRDAAQYIGLVENDRDIRIGKLTHARCRKGEERVMVRFRKDGTNVIVR
jgi:hypothetical protein